MFKHAVYIDLPIIFLEFAPVSEVHPRQHRGYPALRRTARIGVCGVGATRATACGDGMAEVYLTESQPLGEADHVRGAAMVMGISGSQ